MQEQISAVALPQIFFTVSFKKIVRSVIKMLPVLQRMSGVTFDLREGLLASEIFKRPQFEGQIFH